MKKTITVGLLFLLCALLLTSCGKKSDAAAAVEAQIEAIGDVTPESGEPLAAARAAYDALPEADRKQMKKLKQLEKLEANYADLMEVYEYLAELNAVSADGSYSKTSRISDLLDRAEEIKEKYDDLSKDLKDQITGIEKIDALLPQVQAYVDNAQAGAVEYVKAFNRINAGKNYTVTNVYCSKQQGTDGTEMHFYALTYRDASDTEHTVYSAARFSQNVTAEILAARPETFFGETPPPGENDPVEYGNVTLDTAAILEAAGK